MQRRVVSAAVGVALVATVLSSCSHPDRGVEPDGSPAPAAPSATAAPTARLRCGDPIGSGHEPEAGARAFLSIVALPPVAANSGTFAKDEAPHRFMAKTGLWVHAHRPATLSVTGEWTRHVAFTWSTDAQATPWTTKLVIPACPRSPGGDKWMVFPGGFAYDQAACVPLTLTTPDMSITIHESLGRARCA
jgi:hypothetical protein